LIAAGRALPDESRGMQAKVHIVILNWNGYQDTCECLESVMDLAYGNFEVVVVDNGSTDGSADRLASRFPSVTLLRNDENRGFAGANNQAMKHAMARGADYVWLLNNDTIVPRGALSELVRAMDASDAGLASPLIRFQHPRGEVQFCGSVIDRERRRIRLLADVEALAGVGSTEPLSLWGTALLVKRKVIDEVGYLSEKYFAYHEDEEYCLRVHRAGYRCVVVPEASVYHKNSRSTGSNDAPLQVFLRSRNQYFLWMDTLEGRERISFLPEYLSRIVSYGGTLNAKNLPESIDACLDGVWSAFRGKGGPGRVVMPSLFRGVFRFLFSWHPYFWSNLLRGDFAAIRADLARRRKIGQAVR
jgi:GT2 family glycosyltransferase